MRRAGTLTRREVGLGGGQEGVYRSMGKVSRMVAVSKQLTEDIGTMDTALRMRLTAMFRDGDHRAVERCFEPTRGPKRKLKGKTDQKPVVRVGGGGGSGKARGGGRRGTGGGTGEGGGGGRGLWPGGQEAA